MNSEMNNHHLSYTMKDLFAALDPMSSLVSLHQSKQEKEEFKQNRAAQNSKPATMGVMNSSTTASLHHLNHHYTMEDLFEALDPMSLSNLSRIQSFTMQQGPRYKAYVELRALKKLHMKPQKQQVVQQSKKQQQQEEEFNIVTNFTLERGPRYKAYTELRRELKLQMKEKWCHMRESSRL